MNKTTLISILDLVDVCVKSDGDTEKIQKIFSDMNELIPFTSASATIDKNTNLTFKSLTQITTYNINLNWLEEYMHYNFSENDPRLNAIKKTSNVINWRDAFEQSPNTDQKLIQLCRERKTENGNSILVKSKEGSTGVSLTLPEAYDDKKNHSILAYLAPHIHEAFNRPSENSRQCLFQPTLSLREIEILNWAKEGKNNRDIGDTLNISERTIKFHLSNIYSKLQVANRAQAIAKSMHHGIIKL